MKNPGLLFVFLLLFAGALAQSTPLRIAVAANAQFVIKDLQADFKKQTGVETEAIIGSSGKLAAQIKNGAPYDLFLSADMEFPQSLFKEGFGITAPKEYASGNLVVCSSTGLDLKNWRQLVTGESIKRIAIANPALAPYGKAAEQALRRYGLWDKLKAKLVYGESISQVNTYITTGAVEMGFTTGSLMHEPGDTQKLTWAPVESQVYEKIRQGFTVLRYARQGNYAKAMQFYRYLLSPAAKQILRKAGYQTPS
ncbi:MAG: molybdate ABC transporter substrate-binding protein [Williamsia sp.]|nr:molybdate ABC transporter substrate-binding protein [Williamsia sp.]